MNVPQGDDQKVDADDTDFINALAEEVDADPEYEKGKCAFHPKNYDSVNLDIDKLSDENVNIFQNPMQNTIYFEPRLILVMSKHKTMFVDSTHKKEFNMAEFMAQFHETFEFIHVLDDFVLYLGEEKRSKTFAETVYNKLIAESNCDIANCICYKRNEAQSYDDVDPKDFAYHSAMDNMHVHLYHSFDLGRKLTQNEREQIGDEAIINNDDDDEIEEAKREEVRRKMRDFIDRKSRNRRKDKNNKFMTFIHEKSEDTVTFRDCAMRHLSTVHRDKEQNIYKIAQWIKDEKHDTDSLCEYISFQKEANLRKRIRDIVDANDNDEDDHLASNLKRFVVNNNPDKVLYSFGYRFYYWTFYKNNENETNIILKDWKNTRQRKWYDPGNVNYACSEWYVEPRYDSIRDEALNSGFNIKAWIAKQEESKMKIRQEFCRRTKANDFWVLTYGIEADSPLQLQHVTAIVLYTHSSKFCYNFARSFRKSNPFESADSLKRRHSHFVHCAKALRELIEAYGSQLAYSKYKTFYHGISCKMYFKTCHAKIAGPMSTTVDETVAIGTFAGDKGIVLHLVNKNDLTFFIDCMRFSCFSNEQECLFLGGFAPIPFNAIKLCGEKKILKNSIGIISILTKTFSSTSNHKYIKRKQLKLLKRLIKYKQDSDSVDLSQMHPYELDLFQCFCLNLEKINCDMYHMENKELHQGKVDEALQTKLYGYRQIYDMFFNVELKMIKLDLVLQLFPKLKRIVLKSWVSIKYGESKDKALELMQYVLDKLTKELTMTHMLENIVVALQIPMILTNTHCPKGHALKSMHTDDKGWFCDKCNFEFKEGDEVFGCMNDETECDYCVCEKCLKSINLDIKYLKDAIEEYKPQFMQQIGWHIGVSTYKDHIENEYDAIWFTNKNLH